MPKEERFYQMSDQNRRRFDGYELLAPRFVPNYDADDTVLRVFGTGDSSVKAVLRDAGEDFDYSGIRVRVYAAIESSRDFQGGVSYDTDYRFTVELNADGTAVFDKPTESYLVKIDLYSLPDGIGPYICSRFFNDVSKTGDIILRYEDDLRGVALVWRKTDGE